MVVGLYDLFYNLSRGQVQSFRELGIGRNEAFVVFLIYPAYFYPNADTRLSGKKLRTANIFWTEDEGELHKIERKLIKANEIIASSNELIRAENEIKEEKARVDFHNRTFEKIRIVIADDFRVSREYFELHVQAKKDYILLKSFDNAQEAVKFCLMSEVDVVIMDVLMRKGIDGLTASEMIKSLKPDIKIIIATSSSEFSWEQRARTIGVESF